MTVVPSFHVVFSGELAPGRAVDEVRAKLVALFGSPAKVDALFAGRRVLVRRYVSAPDARRYQQAFATAGAICELVPVDVAADGDAKRTLAYGSPAAQPRRTTPVYGSPVIADDEPGPAAPASMAGPPAPSPGVTAPVAPRVDAVRSPAGGAAPAALAAAIPDLDAPVRAAPAAPTAVALATGALAAAGAGALAAAAAGEVAARRSGAPPPGASPYSASPFDSLFLDDDASRHGAPEPGPRPPVVSAAEYAALPLRERGAELDPDDPLLAPSGFGLGGEIEPAIDPGETSGIDISIPRLVRDPATGRVSAIEAPQPERPRRGAAFGSAGGSAASAGLPPNAAAMPVQRGFSSPPGASPAAPVERATPAMQAALERSRFGLTVNVVSLFVLSALMMCGTLSALLAASPLALLISAGVLVVSAVTGVRLWTSLSAIHEAVTGTSTAAVTRVLEAQAGYFRWWGWAHAVGLVLLPMTYVAGRVTDAATEADPIDPASTSAPATVEGWGRQATAVGFQVRFTLAGGARRTVTCRRDPDLGFECLCSEVGGATRTFVTRSEPQSASAAAEFAREGCGWNLALDLDP